MVWALLARFLTSKPPLAQSIVVGLCCGLFAAAAAEANNRDPQIGSTGWLVLTWGVVLGGSFFAGLAYQRSRGWDLESPAPGWLYALYGAVWVLGLISALLALVGEGGFKVAVLAVVPLVLLAPTALAGARLALGRRAA